LVVAAEPLARVLARLLGLIAADVRLRLHAAAAHGLDLEALDGLVRRVRPRLAVGEDLDGARLVLVDAVLAADRHHARGAALSLRLRVVGRREREHEKSARRERAGEG